MNYTLHQLKVFLKIYQLKSITKAAEELFLTQPAVSIQLKNFQNQFDIPLTEIIGRKLYVTAFGKEIAIAAENIINEVNAINYKTLQYKGELSGQLKISVASTGKYVIPYFLSNFLSKNKGIELLLDVTNRNKVIKSLENNEIDFAFVSLLPERLDYEKLTLMQNKLFLIGNTKVNDLENSLENETLIYREKGSATLEVMQKFIDSKNINVKQKITLTSNEAVKQAVIAGIGCSIMPLIGLKNELKNGELKIIDTLGLPITTNWNLVWLKNKKLSFVAESFLEYLQEDYKNIKNENFDWIEKY